MLFRKSSSKSRIDLATASDQMLLELTRDGVTVAFGELWSRHNGSVLAAARAFTGYEPNDLMQEAFLKVYSHVQDGGLLPVCFRAYVATVARRIAIDKARKDAGIIHDPLEDEANLSSLSEADFSEQVLENSTTGQAFKELATRHREVLWYRDVEDLPVQEIARYIGMSPNSTTALIKRAREAFKTAWIKVQLSPQRNLPDECLQIVPMLASYSRGKTSSTATGKIEIHLLDCTHCSALVSQADELHKRLALVLVPMLLLGSAPTYMAWIQSGQNRTPLPAAANWADISFTGIRHPRITSALRSPTRRLGVSLALAAVTASLVVVGTGALATLRTSATDTTTTAQPTEKRDESAAKSTGTDFTPFPVRDVDPQRAGAGTTSEHQYDPVESVPGTTFSGEAAAPNDGGVQGDLTPVTLPPGTPSDTGLPNEAPVTYPAFRPLSTVTVSNPETLLTINGTPGATITINVFDKWGNAAGVAILTANIVTGTAQYDFPSHRGSVINLEITQDYATASGVIRDPDAHKLTDFAVNGG